MRTLSFGDSMLPTRGHWDKLKIIPISHCTYKDVKVGEIICYQSRGFNREGEQRFWHRANVVHRIVGKTQHYALVKGDNRDYVEEIPYNKIRGRVILPNRDAKRYTKINFRKYKRVR